MKRCLFIALLWVLTARSGVPGWSPTASIQITSPQRASVSVGITSIGFGTLWGPESGMLVRIEPGLGGGKLHVGSRFGFSMAFIPIMHADLTAAVLHTWGDPWAELESGQTYIGLELRTGTYLFLATAGVYRHALGADGDHDWIISAGAGLGI